MMHKDEPPILPVSHYELLSVLPIARIETILQKYRLLDKFWQIDHAQKWVQPADLECCKSISSRLVRAFIDLTSNRLVYDATLATQGKVLTEEERQFRLLWDKMRSRYHQKLSDLRLLQPYRESQSFVHHWRLPKDMLMELFQWVGRKNRSELAIVSKQTEDALNSLVFEQYCAFINEPLKKVIKLKDENRLTVAKLKQHWPNSDRELRLLVNSRIDASYRDRMSPWYNTFLATIDEPTENGYLQNPFLRDLVISLLKKKEKNFHDTIAISSLTSAMRIPQLDLNNLHDPTAICLYAKIDSTNFQIQAALWKFFSVIFSQELLTPSNRAIIKELLHLFYLRFDLMVLFFKKLSSLKGLSELILLPRNIANYGATFIVIPSIDARSWILSCDAKIFLKVLEGFSEMFDEDYDVHFWDNLCKQLKVMNHAEINSYLLAYRFPVELKENSGNARFHRKRFIKVCKAFSLIPVEDIKEKIKVDAESYNEHIYLDLRVFFEKRNKTSNSLRLILNPHVRHIKAELLETIFNSVDKYQYVKKNGETVNNLEMLATYIDEECLNYITTPTNSIAPDNSTSIVAYLGKAESGYLYFCLRALRELCEYELSCLFTNGLLSFKQLIDLSKKERRDFLETLSYLPVEKITPSVMSTIYRVPFKLHPLEYQRYLTDNKVQINSKVELVRLMVIPNSQAIIQSAACTQLIKKIGLTNFIRCSSISINYICLFDYLDVVFKKAPVKFSGLLVIICDAVKRDAYARLSALVSAYLFPPAPLTSEDSLAAIGEKRARGENPDLSQLTKLYRAAQEDPELTGRLLEEGERYSSEFNLKK